MQRSFGRQMRMVLGVVALISAALPAFAAPAVPAATSACDQYAGLTAKMAGCIRDSIDGGASVFFTQMYPFLQDAIGAVMTLAVIVYGIMLAFGAVEKVGRDTYIVLMKLAAVVVFCNSSPFIASTVTGAMDEMAAAVVSYTPPSGTADAANTDFSNSKCLQNLVSQQGSAVPIMVPWLGVDCMIDTVIGIHIDPATPPANDGTWFNKQIEANSNKGMSRSLIYLFFGAMQTSILGVMLAIIGFFFIYGMIMLIIRCFFTYIAGYMGVTFLAIISPLIIPMILFKETKQYFDKWAKMLVSFAVQPVLMLIFLIFSLTALDLCVYSGSYSVYFAIAGTASQTAPFDLNKYLTDNKIINADSKTAMYVKADSPQAIPRDSTDTGGALNQLLYSKCTREQIAADATLAKKCNFTYPLTIARHSIDWAKMETTHQPAITADPSGKVGQAISHNVMSSLFFCLMTVFILNGVLQVVPKIVGDLLGDLNQSPIIGSFGKSGAGGGGGGIFSKLLKNSSFLNNTGSSLRGGLGNLGR